MESKYYTPEGKEFRHGDILEWKRTNENNWRKLEYDASIEFHLEENNIDSDTYPIRVALYNIGNHKSPIELRVKYLDKEDIESLGFKQISKYKYQSEKTWLGIGTGDDKKVNIIYDLSSHELMIWFQTNRGEEDILFDGKINNLSELKVLIKQLGIDGE